ncbi:hypothetical protein Cgig2_024579 [Carnegiea gigantea]|uniref:Reverse transcriptase zinc-binding domain-containing protein n=1 Tax=Carnegiea gigantea TaxID=171969 RepID=A0A9Q1QIV5_9CARY|nr:hypothetical protein Cgig2_024579 [Carnegiea gigantea]
MTDWKGEGDVNAFKSHFPTIDATQLAGANIPPPAHIPSPTHPDMAQSLKFIINGQKPIQRPYDGSFSWKIADLIDFDLRSSKEDVIRTSFLPCHAEEILNIPLCHSWPCDKFIWHFSADGEFTVRSAYHLARTIKGSSNASASSHTTPNPWKLLWALNVPPRIKSFGWKMCVGALATYSNIAKRIKDYNINCSIGGAIEDSVTHALLECLLATTIWKASPFPPKVWDRRCPRSLMVSCMCMNRGDQTT